MIDLKAFPRGVFLVNVLGIVYDAERQLLLVGRRENDEYVPSLSWCFPGGRPTHRKDLEQSLQSEIKKKTGIKVKVLKQIFARKFLENGRILLIYYLCKPVGGKLRASDVFKEVKWIKPSETEKYFSTSAHRKVKEMIQEITRTQND